MTSADYLSRPYARRLTPDESGGYVATIQEFPGLIAEGDSAQEALESLERAAASWIDASLETGRDIPEPIDFGGHSGKVALRIPRGLHKRAAEMASSEGASLNQWLTGAIAHYLGSHEGLHIIARNLIASMPATISFTNLTNNQNLHIENLQIMEGNVTVAERPGYNWFSFAPNTTLSNAIVPRAITYGGGD